MSAAVDLFDGMWTKLKSTPAITALMTNGTWLEWRGGLLQRFELNAAMCPLISLGPAGDWAFPCDHHDGAPVVPFVCEIAVDSRDARVGMRLLLAVVNALIAEARGGNRFGVYTLDKLTFTNAQSALYHAKENASPLWTSTFNIQARFRVGTDLD